MSAARLAVAQITPVLSFGGLITVQKGAEERERRDLWRRIGDFDAAIDDYSIVIWSFDRSTRKKERKGDEEAFGQRAISPYHLIGHFGPN